MEAALPRRPAWLAIELALFAVVAVFASAFAELHPTLDRVHPPAALDRLCAFTAELPYQNRVLVPLLVRGVERSGLGASLGLTQHEIARWIEAACVVALFYAVRALLGRFVGGRWAPSLWAALVLYALPFVYILPPQWNYWYPWDVPAVLFTALGLLWISREDWAWFHWVFPFATLNRETTFFLIVAFALTQLGRMKWWTLAQHLAAQAAVWLAIKWLLRFTFTRKAGDVGDFYSDALKDNWAALHSASTWGNLSLAFGFLWLPLLLLVRHVRESFVRRALLVVPLFFACAFALAQFDEVRVYGELIPLVVLGLACGVGGLRAKLAGAPAAA